MCGPGLHAALVAARGLRIEDALVLREREVECGWLERVAIICEEPHVICAAFEHRDHDAETARWTHVRDRRAFAAPFPGRVEPHAR